MGKISKENKIIIFTTIGIIITIIIVLGVTYAYWRLTKEQTGVNIVNSSCLNVTMENQLNDINIPKAYPISDSDGLQLEPFIFKVKNNCEEYADYTISLEMLNETDLNSDFVKISLNEEGAPGNPKILGSYDDYKDLKLEDTVEGRTITSGKLEPNGEKNYELRIWLNGDVEVTDDTMNKTYKSKVVIESTIGEEPKIIDLSKDIPLANDGEDGLFAVKHILNDWNKTEYRYAGVNPDNYVDFNNEKWRIIGLVNVKTTTGVEQRIKIIRTDGISGQNDFQKANYGYAWNKPGTNNWITSTLKEMLNGIYYNSEKGECYTGSNGTTPSQSTCDFSGNGSQPKGLDEEARKMLDSEVIWNIGGWSSSSITADTMYEKERETNTGSSSYPAEWTKENDETYHNGLGIMNPSDYGYAVGGSVRKTCLSGNLYDYDTNNCYTSDWLNANNQYQWLLLPTSSTSDSAFYVGSGGSVNYGGGYVRHAGGVWPVGYLSSSTTIYDGDGSIENPFKLRVG